MASTVLFVPPLASLARPAVGGVNFCGTLKEAPAMLRDGSGCVVVRRAFPPLHHLPESVPAGFDLRNICLPSKKNSPALEAAELGYLAEALAALAAAHCAVSGDNAVRGRVYRASGTPCPLAHVDRYALRVISTLFGPGVVLLEGKDGKVRYRTQAGDAVLLPGAGKDGDRDGAVWHRSPRRAGWMRDRLVLQVDDW